MPSLVVAVILSLILACFAIQNANGVEVDFLFLTFEVPLVIVVLLSFLCGVLVATIFLLRNKYRNYQERKKMNQEIIDLENENSKLQEKIKMLMYNQRLHDGNRSWSDTSSLEETLKQEGTSKPVSDSTTSTIYSKK